MPLVAARFIVHFQSSRFTTGHASGAEVRVRIVSIEEFEADVGTKNLHAFTDVMRTARRCW